MKDDIAELGNKCPLSSSFFSLPLKSDSKHHVSPLAWNDPLGRGRGEGEWTFAGQLLLTVPTPPLSPTYISSRGEGGRKSDCQVKD